jgi:hypothetical protein
VFKWKNKYVLTSGWGAGGEGVHRSQIRGQMISIEHTNLWNNVII